MGKNDFQYFSKEFDSKALDLVKQKGFDPYALVSDFKKLKEEISSK